VLLDEHSFLGKNVKLAPKYSSPNLVKRIFGHNNVELLLNNGKLTVVHTNRLKLFHSTFEPDFHKAGGDISENDPKNFP